MNGIDSDDSDAVRERKEQKRIKRQKDEDYLRALKKFEERERRMTKQYEREDEDEQARKKALQKEAKKLAQFLENYDDDRDDPKYYKSSSLSKRKHDYELEREKDRRDREDEAKEIEKLKAQILAENKGVDAAREHEKRSKRNGTSSPHAPLDQRKTQDNEKEGSQPFHYSFVEEKATPLSAPSTDRNDEWTPVYEKPSTSGTPEPTKSQGTSKVITTFQSKVISQVNTVFGEDDPEEENLHVIKKKIKPFEITAQDRIESLTAEERKQMVKELIEAIPTSKQNLFDYQVKWDQLDEELVGQRVKPWVEKKIRDYIGDDEPSLVEFICERVTTKSDPTRLLGDLAMILDDEAEAFMIKLWRLIIFQTEAKKMGLNVSNTKP